MFIRERKEREHQREKERHYREKMSNYDMYKESYVVEYVNEKMYKERKDESSKIRHVEYRKYQERKVRESLEKHKREKYEEDKRDKSIGDRTLHDLRKRLLSKRSGKGEGDHKFLKSDSHRDRRNEEYESLDNVLQGEAGMYVKEIINISTEDRKHRKEYKEVDKLTEEERAEQEIRREKLLEAGNTTFLSANFIRLNPN